MEFIQYLIVAILLILIGLIVVKVNKKDFSSEVNKLVKYLGGKDNIINAECNMSRFKVIVEIDNQLKIIFGKDAKQLKEYIKDYLK